jgi:hypothetical protein
MMELYSQLMSRSWFVDGIGYFVLAVLCWGLIWSVAKVLGSHMGEMLSFLREEAIDFAKLRLKIGGINFLCVIVMAMIGTLVIFAIELQKVVSWIMAAVGKAPAEIFEKSADFQTLLLAIAVVLVASLTAVAVDARKR